MSEHNRISQYIEQQGLRTFSTREMAFNIVGLLHRKMLKMSEKKPIYADLTGRWSLISRVDNLLKKYYDHLTEESNLKKVLYFETRQNVVVKQQSSNSESDLESQISTTTTTTTTTTAATTTTTMLVKPRPNMRFDYPKLKEYDELLHNPHLRKLIDLEHVVVVTGFGETGPWGNSRTRWEMEAFGEFSLEGCVQMAWIMGFIQYKDRVRLSDGRVYTGWVDCETGEIVDEFEIKQKYEQRILEHSGIR
jgi:3-oxoacyl-ACP reductase-like protein